VWVANSLDLNVSKLDPATGRMIGTVPVGDGPSSIVAARGTVWVSDEFDGTLDRINPRSGQVDRRVRLGSSPQGMIAAGPGRVGCGAPVRGGRPPRRHPDRRERVHACRCRHPVQAYETGVSVPALATAYDGLVELRRTGDPLGLTLILANSQRPSNYPNLG